MSFVRRVVFDTSTLISAVLRPDSLPHQAFLRTIAEADLCASTSTLAELEAVLSRDKFDRYCAPEIRQAFFDLYRQHARLCSVSPEDEAAITPACRDPRDNKFLALAQICGAELIVSSDDDLLALNPWNGISLILPKDYLARP